MTLKISINDLLVQSSDEQVDLNFFNRRFTSIMSEFTDLDARMSVYDAQVADLVNLGLARMNDAMGPMLATLTEAAGLGFLVCEAIGVSHSLTLGAAVGWDITSGADIFTPTAYLLAQDTNDSTNWGILSVDTGGWVQSAATLATHVVYASKTQASSSWTISCNSAYLPAMQTILNSCTAAQTACDADLATVAADMATVNAAVTAIQSGPVLSVAGKNGVVTLVESDIANLTSDLAARATITQLNNSVAGLQPSSANLSALAGLTLAANKLLMATGAGTLTQLSISSFMQTFLNDADAPTARSALGLATVASSGSYNDLSNKPAIATTAQAQAGTDDTTIMTPLKTAQAITALDVESGGGNTWSIAVARSNGKPLRYGNEFADGFADGSGIDPSSTNVLLGSTALYGAYIVNGTIAGYGTVISGGDSAGKTGPYSYNTLGTVIEWTSSQTGSAVTGAAYIGHDFQVPVEVTAVQYGDATTIANIPPSVKLQYSDNGTTWSDALTFYPPAMLTSYTYSPSFPVGAHRYWRILANAAVATGQRFGATTFNLFASKGKLRNFVGPAPSAAAATVFPTTMTSNNSAGAVTSSGVGNAYQAFDGNDSSTWSGSTTQSQDYIQIDLGSGNAKSIAAWQLKIPTPTPSSAAQAYPSFWLLGSNDGSTWTPLDYRPGANGYNLYPANLYFTLDTPTTAYRYFRWYFGIYTYTTIAGAGCCTYYVNNVAAPAVGTLQAYAPQAVNNMTLVTAYQTADASVSHAQATIEFEPIDTITLNTDITCEVTTNGGTNWTLATLSQVTGYADVGTGRVAASIPDTATTAGTSFAARIKTLNNKKMRLHGVDVTVH